MNLWSESIGPQIDAVNQARPRFDLIHRLSRGDVTDEAERRAIVASFDEFERTIWQGLEAFNRLDDALFQWVSAVTQRFIDAFYKFMSSVERFIAESVYRFKRILALMVAGVMVAWWLHRRIGLDLTLAFMVALQSGGVLRAVWEPP